MTTLREAASNGNYSLECNDARWRQWYSKKSPLSHLSSYVFDEPRLYIFGGESRSCSQKMQRYGHAIAIAQALRLITPITHILKGSLLFNDWISTYHESKCLCLFSCHEFYLHQQFALIDNSHIINDLDEIKIINDFNSARSKTSNAMTRHLL